MAIEMRKRPIVKGKNASNFFEKTKENQKKMEAKKAQALKKWNDQIRETKD